MKIDLKNMTRKELEKLGRDVEKALEKIQKRELKQVRAEMEKLAAAHGVSIADVLNAKPATRKTPKAKTSSAAKYANPKNPAQTWTGKGRQPNWFKAAVDAGAKPESLAV